jgi:hypothetical protein
VCSHCQRPLPLIDKHWIWYKTRKGYASHTCRACTNRHRNQRLRLDSRASMLGSARLRARKHGRAFSLKVADLFVPATCPVLGIPLFVNAGGSGPSPNSPSLDRIDSSKGYTPDNVMVISHKANCIKSSATPQELRRVADFYNR